MKTVPSLPDRNRPGFRLLPLILVVTAILLAIPLWLNWYSERVSLPRYCNNPQQTLIHLRQILTEPEPAGTESRRPWLITAKLLFLLPRRSDEDINNYLLRVGEYLRKRCDGN